MNYRTIAEKIPDEYRSKILHDNMIDTAQAHASDRFMSYLVTIWKNYLEPDIDLTCGQCYLRVLTNYKNILPEIVRLEKEKNLLNSL